MQDVGATVLPLLSSGIHLPLLVRCPPVKVIDACLRQFHSAWILGGESWISFLGNRNLSTIGHDSPFTLAPRTLPLVHEFHGFHSEASYLREAKRVATKNDSAEVDEGLWRPPGTSDHVERWRNWLRGRLLLAWRLRLTRCALRYLRSKRSLRDHKLNKEGIRECLTRASQATWWSWSGGSRPFFWRWPSEFLVELRDGFPFWETVDQFAPYVGGDYSLGSDLERSLMKQKMKVLVSRGYLLPGPVTAFIPKLAVPKGTDNIRIVWDCTKSGVNAGLWAPSFSLPTMRDLTNVVGANFYMGDIDVGEAFYNFVLHTKSRHLFGAHTDDTPLRWVRPPFGARPAPYQCCQSIARALEVICGDPGSALSPFPCFAGHAVHNPMNFSQVRLNLPGSPTYCPGEPWVSKVRAVDGGVVIANDCKKYVDDIRTTGLSYTDCWETTRRVASGLNYLGIQDAPRKRREISQSPGPWAGALVHTTDGSVRVAMSQEKWDKAQVIVKALCVESKQPVMDHHLLQVRRGFLMHAAITYPFITPFLKGIHLTIENWRGGRDAEGWKTSDGAELDHEGEDYIEPIETKRLMVACEAIGVGLGSP